MNTIFRVAKQLVRVIDAVQWTLWLLGGVVGYVLKVLP